MQWKHSISGLGGWFAGEDAPRSPSVDRRLSGQLRVSCVKSEKSCFSVKKKQKAQHRKKAICWGDGEGHTRVMLSARKEPSCSLRLRCLPAAAGLRNLEGLWKFSCAQRPSGFTASEPPAPASAPPPSSQERRQGLVREALAGSGLGYAFLRHALAE